MQIQIGLIGALGRMGQRMQSCIAKDPELSLIWQLGSKSPRDSLPKADVIIDFSSPSALESNLALAQASKTPFVIGITGLQEKEQLALKTAALHIPIFWASNFSLGMAALIHALKTISPLLQKKFTPHIEETHHVHKKDSPSGAALLLAEAVQTSDSKAPPIKSLRIGEVIGDHSVSFSAENEILTLRHESLSRDVFALGALEAAKFLIDKPVRLYQMQDLL